MYTAVLIEPRLHKAFKLVLSNFFRNLNQEWTFKIFHSPKNYNFLVNLILSDFPSEIHRVSLIELNVDNLNGEEYSKLLFNPDFYNYISTEMFLIFQLDTLISDEYKDLIYNYMDYDYVGAPWSDNQRVGNGGLSLRKKSKMLEIIKNNEDLLLHYNINEDLFFSNDGHYLSKPSFEDAKLFSIETTYSDKSFGIHKCWEYITDEQLKNVAKFIPEIYELIALQ
jgi:hypothetical protein